MSEINFREEEALLNRTKKSRNHKGSFISSLLIKYSGGLVKDQQQANKVLLVITITLFLYTTYLLVTKVFS
jgi:hypothetical protein